MENVLKPLARISLIPLGWTAAASATDTAIHKKMFESGVTTLIISNKEMNDIIKIVKSLEESGLFTKSVSETIRYKEKKQNGGFLSMLLDAIHPSLIENLLTGNDTIRKGEAAIRAGQDFYDRLIL